MICLVFFPLLEALLSSLPVDNVPDGVKVLGLAVLVLQVVGVLPGVDSEDRSELADNGVLVLRSGCQYICVKAEGDGCSRTA